MVTNPKFFGQSTTGTPNQVEDGVDFPHTGLLKALSTASSGRYAISGFDITPAGTTGITVAAGEIIYNGKVTTVNGASLTLSSSHTNGYHLLVAPRPTNEDSNAATPLTSTVVLRNPAAANKVPDYTLGDTIIAVITHTGSDPHIQYLTYDKTSQAFSIAHDNSIDGTGTTYTEMGTIEATATGIVIQQDSATNLGNIEIKNNDQDRDIIFTMDDGGVEKSITLNADIATAQFADFSITTNGSVTAGGVTLSGGGTVANHGNNRIITSGATNTDLNGEANMTFDGANVQLTGSIVATGGLDAGLAVNANILSSASTTTAGGNLIAQDGILNRKYFAQTVVEVLDVNPPHTMNMTGEFSTIFIGDITTQTPTNTITLPPALLNAGKIFTFKSIHSAAVTIVPQGGDLIDNGLTGLAGQSRFLTGANQITLDPLATITLIAIGAEEVAVPPLNIGYYILNSTT